MNGFSTSLVSVVGLFIGLAVIAVLVSKNAQTAGVITAFGTFISGSIKAAVAPVSS